MSTECVCPPDYATMGAILGGFFTLALAVVKSAKGCYFRIPCCCAKEYCIADFNKGRPNDTHAMGSVNTVVEVESKTSKASVVPRPPSPPPKVRRSSRSSNTREHRYHAKRSHSWSPKDKEGKHVHHTLPDSPISKKPDLVIDVNLDDSASDKTELKK